ncbi:hypothetical protein [Changchengzhania lutea]|uniref:hypothetical protein n=1 Tax=Changchengzhania lutea TaxID=2049305 RepID=UPI00115ED35A|nr:hypothetical protein [Changchengzhania lutea]
MNDKLIPIKEVPLKNNCPECYSNDGLRLTFKQRFFENTFYKSIKNDITHELACKTCNTSIYPVQWTEDIERVFEYHKKGLRPKRASTYLKKATWIILALVGVIVISAVAWTFYTTL